jgi:predicted nucleotidyltransferase
MVSMRMPMEISCDPVLVRFRAAIDALYGDRIERVVVFGSRARGEAHAESDYDVAVFIREMTNRWHEVRRLSAIETDILADTGAFIHSMPYSEGAYRQRTPLMHEIRREGVDL